MKNLEKLCKDLMKSVNVLEHPLVRLVLIVVLVLYISNIVKPVNRMVSSIVREDIIRLVVVVVIALVGMKDPLLALLLGLALVVSVSVQENMDSEDRQETKQENKLEEKKNNDVMKLDLDPKPSLDLNVSKPEQSSQEPLPTQASTVNETFRNF